MMRSCLVLALVLLWSATGLAHDAQLVTVPPAPYAPPPTVVQAPIVQAPIVQAPIVQSVAAPYFDARPRASILRYGFQGVFSGALVGLGAGYFVARDGDDSWRDVGISTSIGAVTGAALGLGLGIVDRLGAPAAHYIARDLTYGILFGAMVGALCGGIVAIGDGDGEAVMFGAAAGTMTGVGLGLATGILEGHWRTHHQGSWYGAQRLRVSATRLAPDSRAWGAQVSGHF